MIQTRVPASANTWKPLQPEGMPHHYPSLPENQFSSKQPCLAHLQIFATAPSVLNTPYNKRQKEDVLQNTVPQRKAAVNPS